MASQADGADVDAGPEDGDEPGDDGEPGDDRGPDDDGGARDGSGSTGDADASSCSNAAVTCANRACGKDPICTSVACGECGPSEACVETTTGAACKAATIIWEVDGVVVTKKATHEAFFTASTGNVGLYFPYWGRNVSINLPVTAGTGMLASCPSTYTATVALTTSDNSWADLGALPSRWKDLVFTTCGAQAAGDVVTARDVMIMSLSPARIAGTYEIIVQGGGPRAGSTLRVHGSFDVTPGKT